MNGKDFAAVAEQISLHGLGFIQVKLPEHQRLHVWHPDLPRRSCFAQSAIHNHRFSFESQVIAGTQINRRWKVIEDPRGGHDLISHDGPRSEKGGRLSYVAGRVHVDDPQLEVHQIGQRYFMPMLQYHDTPNEGVVITLMTKLTEGTVHAASLIEHGYEFDQSFDRFQLSAGELWAFVVDAFKRVGQ
ncbi:hypothetical protein [Sphingomonas sp. SRS2]|uniref:hypothetical protein n=1 Tax=Sphingomonas sp. SRS2 TaxID=133190 RepID=UPI0006986493|nr:hypothetical protein [Sphingomonas sp. SRS2]